jgi:hypothetical protein
MADKSMTFAPFGNFGVAAATPGDGFAYVRIPLDKAAGRASKSGKMILTGDTGSFQTIPGTDGLRANISVGYSAK